MTEITFKDAFVELGKAIVRLEEAVNTPVNSNRLNIDGTIQRFEFTIELYWKVLKKMTLALGKETKSPREALKTAYKMGLINHETLWLNMMEDRNMTSHTYHQEIADKIYANIKGYLPELKTTYHSLENEIKKLESK